MSFKRVAQLLLLFKCRVNGEELQKLAYVSWFETKGGAAERSSGLYLVGRTKKTFGDFGERYRKGGSSHPQIWGESWRSNQTQTDVEQREGNVEKTHKDNPHGEEGEMSEGSSQRKKMVIFIPLQHNDFWLNS